MLDVIGALRAVAARTGRKGATWDVRDLLDRLERDGVSDFAGEVRQLFNVHQNGSSGDHASEAGSTDR